MDGRRFDELTRRSVAWTSRRQVLRAIGAAILAGIGFARRTAPTRAQDAATCVQDSDCLADTADPCSGATCSGGFCTYFLVSCIPGHVCCGNGACCPEGAQCQSDLDCAQPSADPCAGARCEGGACVPYLLTCAPGFTCCQGTCAAFCHDAPFDLPWHGPVAQ